jgi:hypothetical protein
MRWTKGIQHDGKIQRENSDEKAIVKAWPAARLHNFLRGHFHIQTRYALSLLPSFSDVGGGDVNIKRNNARLRQKVCILMETTISTAP